MLRTMPAQEVLQRRRREEVLLAQAQVLAGGGVVARVQHARNRFEPHAVRKRAHVVAAVEVVERERVGRTRRPQAQRVDVPPAPAGDRRVERHGIHRLGSGMPHCARARPSGPRLPSRCRRSPRCRSPRDARTPTGCRTPATPQAFRAASRRAAPGGRCRGRSGCRSRARECDSVAMLSMKHAASRPRPPLPSAASGSSARIAFEIDAELVQRRARGLGKSQVRQRVEQHAADQELEREVVHALAPVAIAAARGLAPAIDDAVARRERHGDEPVVVARMAGLLRHHVAQLGQHGVAKRLDVAWQIGDRRKSVEDGGGGVHGLRKCSGLVAHPRIIPFALRSPPPACTLGVPPVQRGLR